MGFYLKSIYKVKEFKAKEFEEERINAKEKRFK